MKVLPLNWFYGGKNPSDNPILRVQPGSYDIAVPYSVTSYRCFPSYLLSRMKVGHRKV